MKAFDAESITNSEDEYRETLFNTEKLFIKGRDERALCTNDDEIEIGFDNLAWVHEDPSTSE